MRFSLGPNRYICSVLDEIRTIHKTRNYSSLLSLVEEAQTLINRMEAGLNDRKDLEHTLDQIKELKVDIKRLEEKKTKLISKGEDNE